MLWQPDCGKTWKRPQSNKLIAETDNDKHWQSYLYEPDSYRPLALVHGNAQQDNIKLYWYQNDHLGTPIALTGSLGDTLYECQYNAYGQIINETYHQDDIDSLPNNPLRFQGQYYDEETGLHYNLNRYYDPFTGRYITQDPLGILGGLNSYQYANNDPIDLIDPLGLECKWFIVGNKRYLKSAEQDGTLVIGAGLNPIEGAYNISHPAHPMAPGVFAGDAHNLSNIATGSQKTIIMDNPYGYAPLNDEVLRVLKKDGTIIIRGSDGKVNKYMRNLEIIAKNKGLQLINKRKISSKGYTQSNGEAIRNEQLNEYIFKKE
ncbi:hypothetical protein A9G41_09035 [Gilliamella sp. Nev5-1]|uniref:RHS repeat domain-containing protein n=1 Tax=unclassified Gilliamella TaxID=2685620 RepID=UPI00080EE59A|nr:RHS repeat-associated core domain-containing protein [Gilliamella apicola]OCG58028.1 hypothetical protein A9G40_00590 [Gilliamella apicola]OCG67867.1 hypothetical protein A9G41_09035 [Gilliamella apicola]